MVEIIHKIFRGRKALAIKTQEIEAVFFTEFGAKLVSLKNLVTGYEFLWQGCQDIHPKPEYDSLYIDNDLCGGDDMFPSINETFYPSFPWKGSRCPDHGELWSLPWEHSIENDSICFKTHGIRFPYQFRRKVFFSSSLCLRFNYSVKNMSPFSFSCIWAFHPLFNIENGTKIILPEGVASVINTFNLNNLLGNVGSVHIWPETIDKKGRKYCLDSFKPDSGVCEKFYVLNDLTEGWVALESQEIKESLRINFPLEKVPYLGIWKNEGGLLNQNNVALEPATGRYDDLWVSNMWQNKTIIEPNQTLEFWLEIDITSFKDHKK